MKSMHPKVSVVCVCYNQEQYIGAALDGFVTQETNFDYEIIVSDDCSTDSTRQIITEYAKKYPSIKPILHTKNQGAIPNFLGTLKKAGGKYVALCEGDDYWTDVNKLQKQVDFLESHPDYAMCFHPVKVVFQNNEHEESVYPVEKGGFTLKKLLTYNFIQTNSVMYRRQDYDSLPTDIMPGDWYLHLYHAQFGKIGFINRVMSVYRRHSGGIWWDSYKSLSTIWEKYGDKYINFLHYTMLMYGDNDTYKNIILGNHIASVYESMSSIDPNKIDNVAQKAIGNATKETWDYMKLLMQRIDNMKQQSVEQEQRLNTEIQNRNNEINNLNHEIDEIKSSKAWKLLTKYRKLHKTIKWS